MRKEYRDRLAKEYSYAAKKMQEAPPERKMFYFSVLFGEATRILNFDWDGDLSLLQLVAQSAFNQINAQIPALGTTLPTKVMTVFELLTQSFFDLAGYYEKENSNKEDLYQILVRLSEITYIAVGNGSYLFEKGVIKF
jgi:hypothetical protein